jgi:hypothetical protein
MPFFAYFGWVDVLGDAKNGISKQDIESWRDVHERERA